MTNTKIDFGLYLPQLQFSFAQIRDRVLTAERFGFHSVWFMDHFHGPGLPHVDSFEAWTLASALMPLTARIRLGHMVLCNAFRHPALVAKMAASLDVIGEGRFELGLGTGSVPQEFGEYGIPLPSFRERTEQLDEALQVMKSLFANEKTSFQGKHYQLDKASLAPKPFQKPHPPITIGGGGETYTLPLVARHADVWNCPTYSLGAFTQKKAVLDAACAKIGRDPKSIRISEQAVLVIGRTQSEVDKALATARRRYAGPSWGLEDGGYIGTPAQIIEKVRARAALGVSLFVFFFADRGAPETQELFAREVMPAFQA